MKLTSVLLTLSLSSGSAYAYEVETHGLFTVESFNISLLGPANPAASDLYARLGFDRLKTESPFQQLGLSSCVATAEDPKQDAYVDAQPSWLGSGFPDVSNRKFRCPTEYDRGSMPPAYRRLITSLLGASPELRFEAWLMRGAIREDDLKQDRYPTANRPDIDPWGDKDRVIGHFYVPVSNTPGTPFNVGPGALRWAMGEEFPIGATAIPDPSRDNHFSYADARRHLFLALTYKAPTPTSALNARSDSDVRQNLWGTTLLSVGHVVHILQDQASPQHARGEAHNYVCRGFLSIFNQAVATRTFENFINYRVVSSPQFDAPILNGLPNYVATNPCEEQLWRRAFDQAGQRRPPLLTTWLPSLGGNTYPIPQFSVARKFFTTRIGTTAGISDTNIATLNARAGLGDYSNRGFYTEKNMAGNALPFISPPRLTSDLAFTDGVISEVNVPGKGKVKQRGLLWAVPDAVAPNYPDAGLINGKAPIVTYGQWGFLGGFGVRRRILTLDNYNQMADMLAPRAIAYSTGLINFFFRGKLIVEAPADGLLGAIDHGILHTVNADGYPICSITITTPENWCTT